MPWLMAAVSMDWSDEMVKVRSLGSTVQQNVVMAAVSLAVVFREPAIVPLLRNHFGALPRRFRQSRILVVGCGDIGSRVLAMHGPRRNWYVLTTSASKQMAMRAMGVHAVLGDLEAPDSLRRLRGLAQRVLYLAPGPVAGVVDTRMRQYVRSLRGHMPVQTVYGSTSAVYGDCVGEWVTETRLPQPISSRGNRRLDAEQCIRAWGQRAGASVSVLRIPGIYAPDRDALRVEQRWSSGTPLLHTVEDVYTNHIHAHDLARACWVSLWRGASNRCYNINDDTQMRMGEYWDAVADALGRARLLRVSRQELREQVSAMQWSFMQESRRMRNERLKNELRVRLCYPTVLEGWARHD